jgi:hypothetical protein
MSITEESLMVGGSDRRRGGRPRSADPSVTVMTRLPSEQYDRLIKMASRREETVSALVRQILMAQSFLK